jgi:multiple sugar transport system permease protein
MIRDHAGQTTMNTKHLKRQLRQLLRVYIPLLPYLLFALFPFYFMVITALKSNPEIYDVQAVPFLIRKGVTFEHFLLLFQKTLFNNWFLNSLFVSSLSTIISVLMGILAAYSLARLKFWGVEGFGVAIFITYLVPPSLLFLPLAEVVQKLGLTDSLWSLVLTYPTFLVPFSTWLLMGYFRTVPKEVEECAMIDGCNRLSALFRIVVPMAIPGIVCAVLFGFAVCWNEFLYSLVFVSPAESKTLTVGIFSELIRGDIYYWGSLLAGAIIGGLPIVIVYALFMDYYVSGLTAGAIK